MFRVDIDDVVISGHPNMISTDGDVCLIPNAMAPKYFYGEFGSMVDDPPTNEEYDVLKNSTEPPVKFISRYERGGKKPTTGPKNTPADYKLFDICKPLNSSIYRDNLDELINYIRYEIGETTPGITSKYRYKTNTTSNSNKSRFAFPFKYNVPGPGSEPYLANFSGYLKNIYVNVKLLIKILGEDSVDTYTKFTEKILEKINDACGNFWDFRLVDGTGKSEIKKGEVATMKVVDYKFMYSTNRGKVYTFDYYDADSLLQGLSFKPTISNSQAIRSMFAPTNNPTRTNTLNNGTNELLDYHFEDRLFSEDEREDDLHRPFRKQSMKDKTKYNDSLRTLQRIDTLPTAYQMTTVVGGSIDATKIILPTPIGHTVQPSPYNGLIDQANAINKEKAIKQTAVDAITAGGTKIVRRLVLPNPYQDILSLLLDDGDEQNNPKYTGIMPGIQATFTIQGIGGLRTFMMFLVRNLPEPYSHMNIVFRIVDVQETVEAGKWTTNITAGIVPLRDYIKTRLGINPKQI